LRIFGYKFTRSVKQNQMNGAPGNQCFDKRSYTAVYTVFCGLEFMERETALDIVSKITHST